MPVLYKGMFATEAVNFALDRLRLEGSAAAPGFMQPEGIMVWHEAARLHFKVTLLKDEERKGPEPKR